MVLTYSAPFIVIITCVLIIVSIARQKRVRPPVKHAFIGIMLAPALINASIILLDHTWRYVSQTQWYAFWIFTVNAAAVSMAYFVLLVTNYSHVKTHGQFLREMKKKPYAPFVGYVALFIAYTIVWWIMLANPSNVLLAQRVTNPLVLVLSFMSLISYLMFPPIHILPYIQLNKPSPWAARNMYLILLGFAGFGLTTNFFGIVLPARGVTFQTVESTLNIFLLALTAYAVRGSGFLHAFMLPRAEKSLASDREYELAAGRSYLVEEEKPDKSFKVFVDQVTHGRPGICITRENPQVVREKYNLVTTPIMWLSDVKMMDKNVIAPSPEEVSFVVSEFLSHSKNSAVLLDGVEYLINHNDFTSVMHLLDYLKDLAAINASTLIIPVSMEAFKEDWQRANLEREMEVLD